MNALGHRCRAWSAVLLGLLAFLPFSAHGQNITFNITSPSEIWRDELDGARVRVTTNLAGGIRTGANVFVETRGEPSGLSLNATLAWGGDPAAVDISITSGDYTDDWILRIWANHRAFNSPNPIWARTTNNGIWVRTKNERHIDVDADPSTENVEEAGPLRLAEGHATLASREYTVKLSTAPTANVTVAVVSGDASALTVDTDGRASGLQSALTFTTENWNTARTVTARAVDDADFVSESVTITHTASGGGYTSSQHTSFALAATVADDEAAQLVVDANPGTTAVDAGPLVLNEGTARTGNYSVKLSRQPTGTTTVALASDNSAVTLSASTLTFTTSNWNSAQTVTATTTQDADSADEAADVTHTASGGGYGGLAATLRVGVTDDERTAADYDTDEDGLIEIDTLAKLNAVRWDLDGDGTVAMGDQTNYAAAFSGATAGMGCPDGGDSNQTADPCIGYELTADLDFDTDGSGSSWSESGGNLTCDSNDSYHNSGSGWDPIGPASSPTDTTHYNAVFEGNGHVIANLCIDRTRSYAGLFAALRPDAVVRSLGLTNAGVYGGWSTAPLAAQSWGRIAGVWTTGSTRAAGNLGGLVGVLQSGGTVVASYSTAAVHCTDTTTSARTGGLVGESKSGSTVFASYATGAVTGGCPTSVKSGLTSGAGKTELSYWDTLSSGIDDDDAEPPEGRSTIDLQTPTEYGTGIYTQWGHQDVDGDGVRGEPDDDDAWNFGTSTQYPALKFGGSDTSGQFTGQPPSFGSASPEVGFLVNQAVVAVEVPAATHGGAVTYTATGLPTGLSFDGDGSGTCSAARTICGTPSVTGTFTVTVWAANAGGERAGLTFTVYVGAGEVLVDADPATPAVDRGSLILDEGSALSGDYRVRLRVAPTAAVTVTPASDNAAVTLGASALTFTTSNWSTWQTVTASTAADTDAVDEAADVTHTASGGGYGSVSTTLRVGVTDDERAGTDYDRDEDGLIEVGSLAQLNAMRWDLNGDGAVAAGNQTSYDAAFPDASAGMGCPDGSDANQTADACGGYELTTDLDFDTDGSGYTWTAPGGTLTSDSNDDHHNGGSGWLPVGASSGRFNTTFDGNGRTIWNLFVNRSTGAAALFGATGTSADIRSLALRNARVEGGADVAPLVGLNAGRVAACWASGVVRGTGSAGGLVGSTQTASSVVVASYSTASVNSSGGAGGGFAGWNDSAATMRTSYSIGRVTGGTQQNGFRRGAGTVVASYWNATTSGVADDSDSTSPEGVTTTAMRSPTAYGATGLYAAWDDQDVDGDGVSGGSADDAWAFGTKAQYPVLKFDGFDPADQFAAQAPQARISVTSPAALTPQNLNNATVTVTLTRTSFGSGVTASSFTLGGTVPGVLRVASVSSVSSGDRWATLTLAYDGESFVGVSTLTVTAQTQAGKLTTAPVKVESRVGLTLSPTSLSVDERQSATYTVALASQPTGTVTVGITGAASGITANPTSLVFTTTTWDTARTVTVRAADDQNSADEVVTLTHAASGAADYSGVTAQLRVTARDDDTPSLLVSQTALTVPEGGSRTYNVRLNTQPSASVTVTVGGAGSGVTVDTSTATGDQDALTFARTNWSVAQTVTVSAAEDDNSVDESVTLTHAAAGGDYGALGAAARPGVAVTADDNDTPAVLLDANPVTTTVDEAGPLALQELPSSGTNSVGYTVRLATEPTETVTVTVTSADAGAVTVDTQPASGLQSALTFTSSNWDTRRTVTLAAQQDADGVHESVVVTNAASTAGMSEYTGLSATLTATVQDDEAPGFVFDANPTTTNADEAGPLNLDELAGSSTNSASYAVRLTSQPSQDVTVSISSPDTGAVTVGTSTLTFTTTNWGTRQTVALTAQQDVDGADESVDVAHAASTATNSEYTGITGDFAAAVDDDETPGLTLSPTSLTVQEQDSGTYTVVLDTPPKSGGVTVAITGAADGVTASPTRLVFTAANWDTARTVTARAADDDNSANEVVTLTHAASGGEYAGVSEDLEVTTSDDDQPGLRVSPTQLTVVEEAVATYRVRLNAQPSAAVTVTVGGATAKVGVDTDPNTTGDQTELAFDATDWNRWKTVRVRGIDDDDGADETASLTHAVAGAAEYTGLALLARPGVAVTVDDRDVATVALSRASLALSEGGGAAAEGMWTVRLANLRPTGPVSVSVTSGDPAVVLTGAPVTLSFTTANWDTAQSVAATAVDDDNAASERVEVRHAASGANYGGAEAVLRVVVTDDEAPPNAPAGLAATPGDGSAALSWSNPQNPSITRYEHRFAREGAPLGAWRAVAGAGPDTTSLTIPGLVNGRAYVFEVRAGNEIGDGEASRTAARLAAAPAAPAAVPDAALAAAVRAVVGKSSSAPLTAGDLAQVLELDLSRPAQAAGRMWRPPQTGGGAVKDLRGMEAMPNLRRLYLDNNEVADLSPLLGLLYLEHVSARGNPLTSDSVFVHAAALRARGVEVLLDAATLATLSDPGLRRAVEVALGKDPGAALTEGDLLTLSSLSAEAAGVASLSGLEAASRLESLTLSGNAPAAGGAAMPLSPLAGLRSLTHLDLSDNGLTDVSALSGMTGLRSLLLAGNALRDLSPLSGLTGLRELTLSRNGLTSVSALSGLTGLRQLWLDGNALESVKPLRGLSSLVYLHLGDNRLSDVGDLAWLAELRRLWLPGNFVGDVSPLSGLWRLDRLDLERNLVAEVSPLAGLPELSLLRLGWNRVADVSALAGHAALEDGGTLGLRGNPLGRAALRHQVPALRRAGAAVVVGWPAPLFPSASDPSGRGGFVRVLNRSETAGEALVEALDEAGRRVGPVRLALPARAAAHFNSADLENGNAAKGLPAGVGAPTRGSWRLLVSSTLDVEVLAYLRAPDGSLAAMHGELPRDGGRLSAFFLNPGGDREQRGSLRTHNPGATAATVWPWGVDDAGRGRSASAVEVPAGATASMSARDLELSRWGRRGLGDGEGRWRLRLGAPWPLSAQSLLEGPNGHLSNLSAAPVRAAWALRTDAGWDADANWALRLPLFPAVPAEPSAGEREGPAPRRKESSAEEPGRDGLARVVNLSPWEGWAQVAAVDDAGVRAGPVRLRLPPRAAVHFDSADLANGNAAKGLSAGVGAPTRGAWRLELRGNVAFAAAAYARHADGFLTSLHETAPAADGSARVALFNPASNNRQRSLLRLANDGAQPALATISGMDDAGAEAGPVSATVPAGEALTLTAVQLEQGGDGLQGALGDGEGKWRLTVAFDRPLVVISLMESLQPGSARRAPLAWESPDARLSNLSATPRP